MQQSFNKEDQQFWLGISKILKQHYISSLKLIIIFLYFSISKPTMKSIIFSSLQKEKSKNMFQMANIYKKVKVAIAKLFSQDYQNNHAVDESIINKPSKRGSPNLKNYCKERLIIKTKQMIFLEDVVQRLQVMNYKKLEQIENREKIKLFVDMLNVLDIIKNRLSYRSYHCYRQQNERFRPEYENLHQEIQYLQKLLFSSNIFKKKQNQDFEEKQSPYSKKFHQKHSEHKSQNLSITRPSSAYPMSTSSVFMNNYIKNIRKKQTQNSNSQPKKFHSQHEESKPARMFFKCSTAKLNNRNTMQINKKRDSIKPHKSLSAKKQYVQHLYSKHQSAKQILDQNSQFFQSRLKNKKEWRSELALRQSFLFNNKNDKLKNTKSTIKMVKYSSIDQQQKENSRKYLRRQQDELMRGTLRKFEKKATLNQTFERKSRKYFEKTKNNKGKLRKGHVKQKKTIHPFKTDIDKQQSQKIIQSQSFRIIVNQALQNEEYTQNNNKDENCMKVQKILDQLDNKKFVNSQIQIKKCCNSIDFQQQIGNQDQIILKKSNRRTNCNLLKRNAHIYKQQDLLHLKLQIMQKQMLAEQPIEKTNIFDQLLKINKQLNKQNQFSIFFKQQQKLKQISLAQQRKKERIYEDKNSGISNSVKNFPLKFSESSNKVTNIKHYERRYSFLSDEQWIKQHWGIRSQNQLIQAPLK